MHKTKKRVLSVMLALSILAGLLFPAAPVLTASAAEKLVNVALDATATTEDGSYQSNVVENVIDGDLTTNWQTQGKWPATAVIQLDMGRSISEVAVKLGGDDDAARTVTVVVEYAQNGVTSDLIAFGTQTVTLTGSRPLMPSRLQNCYAPTRLTAGHNGPGNSVCTRNWAAAESAWSTAVCARVMVSGSRRRSS